MRFLKRGQKNFYILCLWSILLTAGFVFSQTSFYRSIYYGVWDVYSRIYLQFHDRDRLFSDSHPIVVVRIDETSYREMDLKWPWEREVIAKAVQNIARHEPRALAINMAFMGRSSDPASDEALAEALESLEAATLAAPFDSEGKPQFPRDIFLKAAGGWGFSNFERENDGVVRRSKFIETHENSELPAFALSAVRDFLRDKNYYPPGASSSETRASNPAERGLLYRIHPKKIPNISFIDAYRDSGDLEKVRGKLVFLGIDNPLLQDEYRTPLGYISGILVQAAFAYALLSDGFVRELPVFQSYFAYAFVSLFTTTLLVGCRRWVGFAASFSALAVIFVVSFYLFMQYDLFWEPILPSLSSLLAFLICATYEDSARHLLIRSLHKQVSEDALTKVFSYRYFELFVKARLKSAGKNEGLVFIIFDVDNFKEINDKFGHLTGNRVLKHFARALRSCLRGDEMAARFGGDEFCVILFDAKKERGEAVIKRMLMLTAATEDHDIPAYTYSVGGITGRAGSFSAIDSLLNLADKALYESKGKGKAQHHLKELDSVSGDAAA